MSSENQRVERAGDNSELRVQEYEFREPESGAGWRQTLNSDYKSMNSEIDMGGAGWSQILNLEYKSMSSENQRVGRAGDKLWTQSMSSENQRVERAGDNSELRIQEYEFREPESGAGWR